MPDAGLPSPAERPQPEAMSAATAFDRGVAARRAGNRDEAAGWFRRALELDPAHPRARLDLATTLREQRRVDEAEPLFRALLAEDPRSWPALVGLGLCARLRRDLPASAAHLAAALALAPRERSVRLELATTLREQHRADEAEPLFRGLLAEDPRSAPALVGLGLCARLRRDLPASAEYLAAALALAPRERSVRLEYATTLREQRRAEEAEPLYRAVLAEDPRAWQALVGLGLCARIRRDLPDAAAHLAAALALVPRDRTVRLELATTLREQRRLEEAEPLYRALLAEDPRSWQAMAGLGLCARARRDLPAAAAQLAAALALAPREPSVRLEYGTTLRDQRRLDEAEAVFQALLSDEPRSWQAMLGLGLCARIRRTLDAAAEWLAAAQVLAPRDRTVRLEYAHTLREQRRAEAAAAAYQALLADEPGVWQALVGLAQCARMRNDRAAALAHCLAATQAAPEAEGAWVELAGEHRDAGRFDDARAVLRALLGRGLGGAPTWLALGLVDRTAGERMAALEAFRQGYACDPERHHFMVEMAIEERALGHFDAAEQRLRHAAGLEGAAGAALFHLGEMVRARQQVEDALELFQRAAPLPGAPVAVYAAIAQTLADLGRADEAFAVLDAAERQIGSWPEITLKRIVLLRRAGFRDEALAAARAAVAALPGNFGLWVEWFETERFSGDFAGIDRVLAAAPAGTVQNRAQEQIARGQLAAQRWQFDAAAEAFRAALALNPVMPGAHESLARVHLLRLDVAAARDHLQAMAELRAPSQRHLGLSPHLTHTHIGSLLDEYAIDRAAIEALVATEGAAPADRIARLAALVRASPDHTPSAIALLVALRQAGWFDGPWDAAGPPGIPATIAQYWNDATPPDDVVALMQSWREQNPGYRYRRFDHEGAQAFLRAHCPPEVLRAYRRAREPAMKADLFRLAYLFSEGGCYADADDRCLRPLDALLPAPARFVAFHEEYGTLGNNFLAAAPLHPVFGLALQLAVQAINRGDDDMMWLATGPGLMTRALARTLATPLLLPTAWLRHIRILDRHELERVVATHCAVGYKITRRHWLRATFGQPKAATRGPDMSARSG